MTPEQAAALRKPFEPQQIGKLPKGNVMLDYVGHAAATDRLLAVDAAWSWEPFALDQHGLPALDAAGNLWIRLTICGVTRPGVGDGKTMKERVGDAIRNSAMRFGVALDLWAKEDLQPGQSDTAPDRYNEHPQHQPPQQNRDAVGLAKDRAWRAVSALYPDWTQGERITEIDNVLAERKVSRETATAGDLLWAAQSWEDELAAGKAAAPTEEKP